MKIVKAGIGVLALVVSAGAIAEGAYWGGVAGIADFDFKGVDNPLNLGLRAGYVRASGFGVEGEYTSSLLSGETEAYGRNVDVDIRTLATYATYRTEGDWYLKGRLGLLYEDVSVGSERSDDLGVSLGAGIGYSLNEIYHLELEYTVLETDVSYWSGGFSLRF
ncbi:outer membrane beta-barrel protein [Microbulbifer sp. PAAF003]|uniref:outer membrane beta-barrel protein n=1 Tax=Microbulbifer sp. PAAF003 TaxID=3243375 RepID=UPI004039B246